jgi:hypothetical protein
METWPDGLFRMLLAKKQRTYWFDNGSSFFTRLNDELGDIPHGIKSLRWSGKNSVLERDSAAYRLAEHLSAEHNAHPQATQLVVAHSHGGNIALRALHYIQKRGGSLVDGEETVTPLVVTLATPFIEIHQADVGQRSVLVRIALLTAIATPLGIFTSSLWQKILYICDVADTQACRPHNTFFNEHASVSTFLALAAVLFLNAILLIIWWYWIFRRGDARQKQIEELSEATRISEAISAERLMIIRAVDVEAYLLIALGTIFAYIFTTSIVFFIAVLSFVPLIFGQAPLILLFFHKSALDLSWYQHAFQLGCSALIIAMFGALIVSRLVHGRELAKSPMDCQINTQSAPDGTGIKIVTLVSDKYVKWFGRHGIYERDNCAKTISDWVRAHLGARRDS